MMSQYKTKKDEPVIRCWWVNQNKTYKAEVRGGYMWSPKMTKHGHFNQFYENMTLTRPGDLVFSLAGGLIKNIGTVSAMPRSAPRPDDLGKESDARDRDGWLVMVDYEEQTNPIAPREHMDHLGPLLPAKYSPLLADGKGKRVYLAEISPELALTLQSLIGDEANKEQLEIQNRTDIDSTYKLQLVRSRVGQGQYRQNLSRFEPGCRITNITDGRFLIASHIKPWSKSNDFEKLDGNNGLFLSPHIDHLFDRGYISFKDNGKLMIHPTLPAEVSDSLGLVPGTKTRPLSAEQSVYMQFHRKKVFGKRTF